MVIVTDFLGFKSFTSFRFSFYRFGLTSPDLDRSKHSKCFSHQHSDIYGHLVISVETALVRLEPRPDNGMSQRETLAPCRGRPNETFLFGALHPLLLSAASAISLNIRIDLELRLWNAENISCVHYAGQIMLCIWWNYLHMPQSQIECEEKSDSKNYRLVFTRIAGPLAIVCLWDGWTIKFLHSSRWTF